jgi:DNA polymerase III delta subunit
MIVTLTGNNFYLLKRRLDELVSGFVKEHGELALQRIDAQEAEPEAILEAVQSLPFLAARKLVVLRALGSNKTASGQIEQIISSAGDSTDIIFYEPSVDKRTVYFKVLKSQTQLEEYNDLDTHSLIAWQLDLIALAMYSKGRDANQIAKDSGLSPYPVTKAQRLAGKMDETKLKDMVNQALKLDELSKTTPLDLDEALKTYIVTL